MNWTQIKHEYITGTCTMKALAEKYGCAEGTVLTHAAKERWRDKRLAYRGRTLEAAIEQSEAKETQRLSGMIGAVKRLTELMTKTLEDDQQFFRYVVKEVDAEKQSVVSEKVFHKMDTAALRNVTGALKGLTALLREFYNVPTPAQAHAQHIAEEKLEIGRARVQTAQEPNEEVGVVILPEVKDREA
nr:MAG TPA: helix-turn-helix, Psq domain [Caudoviricetes sp.]